MKFTVMVSQQGTACAETALCPEHDTPENRERCEKETKVWGRDRGVRWVTGVENEALSCTDCGRED